MIGVNAIGGQPSNCQPRIPGRKTLVHETGPGTGADANGSAISGRCYRVARRSEPRDGARIEPTGVEILRIHSIPSFGLMWLLPRLALFQEANGDIQLNLACWYEDVSFTSATMTSTYGMATLIGPTARSKRYATSSSRLLHRRST